ncbi:unnamed protein product, partial [Iphiclides podalirius]
MTGGRAFETVTARLRTERDMKAYHVYRITAALLLHAYCTLGEPVACDVRALTESGWVCGLRRWADKETAYASFRGVPYAKQPLGELRFKELQPADPWDYLDASEEGPICPQQDVFYGKMMTSQKMDEACIYANIHVPIEALPVTSQRRPSRDLKPPYETALSEEEPKYPGLPILVFVHGGGFAFGSGDSDVHGPEYLMTKGVIVITFNYRLNALGFLSLNTPSVPGNNGLRDILTMLRWVRSNARAFGGDPEQVTLAGQSAGASAAHLVALSRQAEGLYKRLFLMSGTAMPTFYTTSPAFAQFIANMFLTHLGVNGTDPEAAHRQLVNIPIEKIMNVNSLLLDQFGLTTFMPVVESQFPGVTPVLDEDPQVLLAEGRTKYTPMLLGFTSAECESFRPRFEQIDIITRINENPLLMLSPNVIFNTPTGDLLDIAKRVEQRYFNGSPSMDKYISCCSDTYYIYPALKLAKNRRKMNGAPTFLYQFSYEGESSVIKEANGIQFKGVGHVEDMTYMFRVNSIVPPNVPPSTDDAMRERMTRTVRNFMYCSHPTCIGNELTAWRPVDQYLRYQDLENPAFYRSTDPTRSQSEMMQFFDGVYNRTS